MGEVCSGNHPLLRKQQEKIIVRLCKRNRSYRCVQNVFAIVKAGCSFNCFAFTDDESMQISALKTLATALGPKGTKDSLCYIYSEYEVCSVLPPVSSFMHVCIYNYCLHDLILTPNRAHIHSNQNVLLLQCATLPVWWLAWKTVGSSSW